MRFDARFFDQLFPGDSEMARRMRAFDWAATELGPPQGWPQNLQAAVSLCLTSRFPISLWWGPRLLLLYNDAYLPWLGEDKRRRALMRPGREVWSEIWDVIGPMLDGVMATGTATWSPDTELIYDRTRRQEEVFISSSFGPILGADGRTVDGVFCPSAETTEQVVGARRLDTLRRLGIRSPNPRTVDAACHEAAAVLRENSRDIPFAAIYVVEGDDARLAASMTPARYLLPPNVARIGNDADSPWPLAHVLRSRRAADCTNLEARGVRIRGGHWPELTRDAVVVPIYAAYEQLAGLLLVGISPRRLLNPAYRTFFDLIAGHIATAIADAQAYEAEQQRAEALAELDRAKTTFFSNVSHELRTPLTLLLGPLEELRTQPQAREPLDVAHRNALRLLQLVNRLLDFGRIEAGRVEAVYEPTDLAVYTTELAAVFRSAIEKAGLALIVECPALPEPVYVDREMWEKIVLNLLSNAFKFTFKGTIGISLRWCGDRVELSVRDTGVGVAASDLPRIFERFHRVRGTRSRTIEGTGIGLSLVKELVRLHGGEIGVQSEEGRGTQISVLLRTGRAHLPKERVGAVRNLASTAIRAMPFVGETLRWLTNEVTATDDDDVNRSLVASAGPRPTLLLADDDADMRDYVGRLLESRFAVVAVADGEAALAAAHAQPFDLVLADVMMPLLDRFGLLKALRDDPRTRDVPVILLSARAGEESRAEGLQAGADDYLIKPFSARELLVRVSARLEIARANRATIERERELRKSAEEAEGMTRLHELGTRLMAQSELQPVLEEILDATISLLNADFGNIQLRASGGHALTIVAQRGFQQDFLDHFNTVQAGTGSCGEVLQRRERVIVEDVLTDPLFAPHLEIVAAAGYRAVQSTPLLSHGGELLGVISTHFRRVHRPSDRELRLLDLYAANAAEVIERKLAREKLRRSESYLAEGQRISHTGSWAVALPSAEVFWSREMFRIYGLDQTTTLSLEMAFQLIHPDDRPRVQEAFGRALRDKTDYDIEHRAILPDGSVKHLHALGHPVLNDSGVVVEYIGTVADVTERKHAEEALRKNHERLEMILASITDRFFAVDSEWRYTHFNKHAEEQLTLLGKNPANFLGHTLWEEFPNPTIENVLRRAMSERVPITDVHYYAPLGEWVENRIYPSPDGGLAMFVTYVTEQKRAEDEKRLSEEALFRYQRELQDLSTRLIEAQEIQSKHLARELHDVFSQQLAVIGMEIGRLARSPGHVRHAQDRLLKITEQIETMARDIHRMSRQIHPAILDDLGLSAAIKSECLAFSEQFGMPAEFISENIPRDLAEDISLCFYRVAQESLRNIGKHAGVAPVRVLLSRSVDEIALVIDDAGTGFDPDRITGKRGLGLVSMEERLRIVGGTLAIRSHPGFGTHVEAKVPNTR